MAAMSRPDMLGGEGKVVQVDEVYLRYLASTDGGRRHAAVVFGLATEGKVLSAIVPDRRSHTLIPQIVARVRPGSKVVSDMLSGYRKLAEYGFEHVQVNHSVAFHDFRGHTNNDIEAYWSSLRRMFRAVRQVSRDNMWIFLAEIEFKYNRRHVKHTIFEELISNFPPYDPDCDRILRSRFDWSNSLTGNRQSEDFAAPTI